MEKQAKKVLIPMVLGVAFSAALNADSAGQNNQKTKAGSLMTETVQGTMVGKTPGFINGPGFYVTGDFLYWQPDVDGTEYAFKYKSTAGAGTDFVSNGKLKGIQFDYEPGFKLGAGYTTDYDDWDVYACWTWLRASETDHVINSHPGEDIIAPLWFPASLNITNNYFGSAKEATGKWEMHYNTLDLNLGRKYFLSKAITFRPHIGLRTAWIDQTFKSELRGLDYDEGKATEFHGSNDFWGIGLRTGIQMQFFFDKNWSLYANGAGALLFGEFDLSQHTKGFFLNAPIGLIEPYQELFHESNELHRLRANLEVGAGFMWETFFNKDKFHFSIAAGWDFVEWFRQNELRQCVGYNGNNLGDATNINQEGDLGLQGFTLSARFDF